MAVNVTGSIKLIVSVSDVRTGVTGAAAAVGRIDHSLEAAWQILSGTTANLADKIWSDTRTVTTGATDALDLSGTLTDAYGAVVTFAKLRAIALVCSSANTTTLQLARPAGATGVTIFAAISDALAPLSAGGSCHWMDPAAGVTVTNSSADIINVINSAGASAIYTVALVGTSA